MNKRKSTEMDHISNDLTCVLSIFKAIVTLNWDKDGRLNAVEVIYAETVCKMKISENKLANTLKTLDFRK
ncbi:hypothetical protein V2P20_19750 [Methylobacter sp. Wu1]|uniref:hypothetical protein n=1 Tax=Methylobacter sp. Wu1 TaxID=3119359 RepID=UPI002F936DAE